MTQPLEKIFKALADQNRLRILALLFREKVCVCDFSNILKISQPSVSKHLKRLKDAGMIESEQIGLWTYYFISPEFLKKEKKLYLLLQEQLIDSADCKCDFRLLKATQKTNCCD